MRVYIALKALKSETIITKTAFPAWRLYVYCNSTDLTVSDIISCALTGKKLTRKFVCRKHNAFTNDEFENTAIASLAFFRNELGLTERKGNPVKYDATVVADGMTIKQKISDRASFYQKIVSPAEKNGNHYLFGNVELLKNKAASNKSEIKIVDPIVQVICCLVHFVFRNFFLTGNVSNSCKNSV